MASFLDSLVGTASGSPSTAFNFGAGAAAGQYPQQQGYTPQDAATVSAVIAAQKAEADRQYALSKTQLDNSYRIALMSARTQQDVAKANADYQNGQMEIARQRLSFDQQTQQQEFGLKQQQFGLQQATLGYNVLGQAAQLRGPANYFQASEYARGASQMPQTSTFLSALQNNARLPGFGAQGGLPQPETPNTLTAKLGGGDSGGGAAASGSASAPENNYLAQIGNIAAKGAGQLGNGALEQLTPTEYGLFTSGLDKLGVDQNTFLDQYRRSRIGQSVGGGYRAA